MGSDRDKRKFISRFLFFCLHLCVKPNQMPKSVNGLSYKSIVLVALLFSPIMMLAQISKSELKQLEKESNYKIISLSVFGINNAQEATFLENKLERLIEIQDCEIDFQNNKCKIIAGFTIQKSEVLSIIGKEGIKSSEYSEEIMWKNTKHSKNQILYADEKTQADKVYNDPDEKEKLNKEMRRRRALEEERIEKEKQEETKSQYLNNLPQDYPRFESTGNQVEDNKKYTEAKQEWIKNNPEKYRQISKKNEQSITEIPYKDFQKMSVEKQDHIKNNPTRYKIIK